MSEQYVAETTGSAAATDAGSMVVEPAQEPEVLRREFPAELTPSGDGRTLEVRIVPYNTPVRVSDPPRHVPYHEVWVPGAFDKQLSAPNRVSVFVNVEHEEGIKGIVGRGTELREVPEDGLHGTFRMLSHPDADKALELVNEGDLRGVSLEFIPIKSVREDGLVKRVKARLVNIALVRPSGSAGGIQAYGTAQVLAVREAPDLDEPEPEPAPEPAPEPEPGEPEPAPAVRTAVEEALKRVSYEPLLITRVTSDSWDGSPARFTDEQYERSALVCRPGDDPPKTRCSLPVLEPSGELNVNGMHAAAARLNQTSLSPDLRARAARKLVRYYRQAGEEPPPSLTSLASR